MDYNGKKSPDNEAKKNDLISPYSKMAEIKELIELEKEYEERKKIK